MSHKLKKNPYICFRCGREYSKPSKSRYLCPECLKYPDDKRKVLWFSTLKHHLSFYNKAIACECCGETLSVLTPIAVMGQKSRHFYHRQCFEKFNVTGNKETIEFIFIHPDGRRESTFEVV
jgi:hypothetical protein